MLPPTNELWPRTMSVCAKGMLTKILKNKFALKNTSVRDGFEGSRKLIPWQTSGSVTHLEAPITALSHLQI